MFSTDNVIFGYTTRNATNEVALSAKLMASECPIIRMTQPHSNAWAEVSDPPQSSLTLEGVDAAFTSLKSVVIAVKTADCLPVLFFHPSGLVGGIHAGRKSTELKIAFRVFSFLAQNRGLTEGFEIWFGPAICGACYQIDPVLDLHFDLVAENKSQLKSVLDFNKNKLTVSGLCTSCRNDLFFSYRKERTSERIFSLIARV